jgi:hypothetical protein
VKLNSHLQQQQGQQQQNQQRLKVRQAVVQKLCRLLLQCQQRLPTV